MLRRGFRGGYVDAGYIKNLNKTDYVSNIMPIALSRVHQFPDGAWTRKHVELNEANEIVPA